LAMILIGQIAGSYDLETVLISGPRITGHRLYPVVLILFVLGAFTKSAQFPFHFWLPNAMAAPTPVSAYLHSATMVKAGVFVLLRLHPALGGTEAWFQIVTGTGLATMLMGAVIALFKHDLKGLLAYSTISHLGLITALAGIGTPLALIAAVFHIVNHAVFKASLFMAAGIIDHETGTRDMRRLSGLARVMPITATLAIIASGAMAGVPLLNGFLSKEMFFEATYVWNNGSPLDNAAPYIAVLAAAFSAAYSLRFIVKVFFGPPATDLPRHPHEPPLLMRLPVAVLVAICVGVGLFPQLVLGNVLETASRALIGPDLPHFSLKIWHGVNAPLVMSLIAMALGALIYCLPQRMIDSGEDGTRLMRRLDFARGFDGFMQMFSLR
ncbi:MAG TPA: proton-conducting transporter membrane subunit, partial [Paracoccus sp. (in: a-proteobacteria)]|nr:proton-conducting transporter membrane subunit [Paracoccus sp. (in: a-proteobacteria)]